MRNINTTKALIKLTLGNDMYHRYKVELKDGYLLSILTGSHYNSAKLQTVEVALMHNGEFVFSKKDSALGDGFKLDFSGEEFASDEDDSDDSFFSSKFNNYDDEFDSDESIIHYMTWNLFLDFIGDVTSWNEGNLDKSIEDIFRQYQDWAYKM
jgi:hypothetical protein